MLASKSAFFLRLARARCRRQLRSPIFPSTSRTPYYLPLLWPQIGSVFGRVSPRCSAILAGSVSDVGISRRRKNSSRCKNRPPLSFDRLKGRPRPSRRPLLRSRFGSSSRLVSPKLPVRNLTRVFSRPFPPCWRGFRGSEKMSVTGLPPVVSGFFFLAKFGSLFGASNASRFPLSDFQKLPR